MDFFKHMRRLSHDELKELAAMCAGVAFLLGIAFVLSGAAPFLPTSLKVALQQNTSQPAAAAWWGTYSNYDGGWPLPHAVNRFSYSGSTNGNCNTHFYSCPLPSYADIYVTNTPTQKIVARVVEPGYYFGYQAYQGPTYSGSIPTVPSGTSVTIEWACQDWQSVSYSNGGSCSSYDAFGNCSSFSGGGGGIAYSYDYGPAVGTNFTAGRNLGTAVVQPTQTTTYGVRCPASGPIPGTPTMSFTVNVSAAPPPQPSVSITGNGTNPPPPIIVGSSVTIAATFAAGSGDTLAKTAINDYQNNLWCGTGNTCNTSMWTASPMGSKSYTFTPPTAGTYIFYPSVQTAYYGGWNNYSASLTVNVSAACPNGSGAAGSCTACNSGYVLQGTSPSNSCAVQCPNGSGAAGSCIACNSGYVLSGGNCAVQCPNGSGATGLCTACNSPYVLQGGNCVLPTGVISNTLQATPPRVRSGTGSTNLSWGTTGMTGGCTLKNDAVPPVTLSTQTSSAGTAVTGITHATVFTLSCSDGVKTYTSTATVTLVPAFKEI